MTATIPPRVLGVLAIAWRVELYGRPVLGRQEPRNN